jgi:Zinc finger, C3HC4 type (RING finger)
VKAALRCRPFLTVLDFMAVSVEYCATSWRHGKGHFVWGSSGLSLFDHVPRHIVARRQGLASLCEALAGPLMQGDKADSALVTLAVQRGALDALCQLALRAGYHGMGLQYCQNALGFLASAFSSVGHSASLASRSPFVRRLILAILCPQAAKLLSRTSGSGLSTTWRSEKPDTGLLNRVSLVLFAAARYISNFSCLFCPRPSTNPLSAAAAFSLESPKGGDKDDGKPATSAKRASAVTHKDDGHVLGFLLALAGIFPEDELLPGTAGDIACQSKALKGRQAYLKTVGVHQKGPQRYEADSADEEGHHIDSAYAFILDACEKSDLGMPCKPTVVELLSGHKVVKGSLSPLSPIPLVAMAELQRASMMWRDLPIGALASSPSPVASAAAGGKEVVVKMTPLAPLFYAVKAASAELCKSNEPVRKWLDKLFKDMTLVNTARVGIKLSAAPVPADASLGTSREFDLSAFGGSKDFPLLEDEEPMPQKSERECIVCCKSLSEGRPTAFIPCLHANCCETCAKKVATEGDKKCPSCRKPITSFGPVFL